MHSSTAPLDSHETRTVERDSTQPIVASSAPPYESASRFCSDPAPSVSIPIRDNEFSVQIPLEPDPYCHAQVPSCTYQRCHKVAQTIPVGPTRSGHVSRIPTRLSDYQLNAAETIPLIGLPSDVHEALDHPGWREAMDSELASIYKNNTWDLVPLPPHRQAIPTKWVFRVKTNADGSPAKLKARLVAKGFLQKEGQDYTETFAPVVK